MPQLRVCLSFAHERNTLQGNDKETDIYTCTHAYISMSSRNKMKRDDGGLLHGVLKISRSYT